MLNRKIKIYQVDAFTDECFKGNPAAVCILEESLDDSTMQLIASEMNLSETAFVIRDSSWPNSYGLRWFTPLVEVPLCGHATLAASKVLYDEYKITTDKISFITKSGILETKRNQFGTVLDFPRDEFNYVKPDEMLLKAMGIKSYKSSILGNTTKKLIIHLESEEQVVNINPDYEKMKGLALDIDIKGVCITAETKTDTNFISRYFNPWAGVNEDPVTGSVHTVLASYWSDALNKTNLIAYQASKRGGRIFLKVKHDRVEMTGNAVIVLKGELYI